MMPGPGAEELAREQGRLEAIAVPLVARSSGAAAIEHEALYALSVAADQFVVRRDSASAMALPSPTGEALTSIIAGYPWFSDWGRDTMIALRGLFLTTGRFAEAREALEAFAALRRRGLIPNCFDDGAGTAQYNTVDASLWYIHAACEYLRLAGDRAGFNRGIRGACLEIVDAYRAGTDFGIRMDPSDGLIAAGDSSTQLTWMDAKRDGIVFTPRHGKAVEINALWYSGLLELAGAIEPDQPRTARELRQVADLAGRSFARSFWNEPDQCLFDCLTPRGVLAGPPHSSPFSPVAQVRPNQLFAVSQPYSPLNVEQRRLVVRSARERLLTPFGLRTLDPRDPNFHPRYEGPLMQRDAAYHNGTVWPWLIGPYCEAVLRVGEFSADARSEVRLVLRPLIEELLQGRPGVSTPVLQLAEVYDGDNHPGAPQRPEGCMAQAWSVAEVLRLLSLATGDAGGHSEERC